MNCKDDLVQQLLELDAEIDAAEQRRQFNNKEARTWASRSLDNEPKMMSGNLSKDASRWIQQLRDQRATLARQLEEMPDFLE